MQVKGECRALFAQVSMSFMKYSCDKIEEFLLASGRKQATPEALLYLMDQVPILKELSEHYNDDRL